jgi:hypothetical protein
MTAPTVYRNTGPGLAHGRLYRVTGTDSQGIVTAEYLRGDQWREVAYEHRRAVLTVRHLGDLPKGYPDSTTRAAVLPRLRVQADDFVAEREGPCGQATAGADQLALFKVHG